MRSTAIQVRFTKDGETMFCALQQQPDCDMLNLYRAIGISLLPVKINLITIDKHIHKI